MATIPQIAFPALAAVALVSALAGPTIVAPVPTAAIMPPAAIVFADSQALLASSCRDTTLNVVFTNGDAKTGATFEVLGAGATTVAPSSAALTPGKNVVSLTIKPDRSSCDEGMSWILRPAPKAGYLGVSSTGNPRRELRPLRLAELSPVGWLPVIGGLALALIVTWIGTPKTLPKALVLDEPIWGGSASSASNLAIGAALLTALLAIVPALDTMRLADRSTYTQLSLLLPALLVASPLVFALRYATNSVTAFLAAAALTLWAAFGQLMTTIFLLFDLQDAGVLPWPTALIFGALCVWLIWLLTKHGLRAIEHILTPPHQNMTAIARRWELL